MKNESGFSDKDIAKAIEEVCELDGECLIQKERLRELGRKSVLYMVGRARKYVWNLNRTKGSEDEYKLMAWGIKKHLGQLAQIKLTCGNDLCLNYEHMHLMSKDEYKVWKGEKNRLDREEDRRVERAKREILSQEKENGIYPCSHCGEKFKQLFEGSVYIQEEHGFGVFRWCSYQCMIDFASFPLYMNHFDGKCAVPVRNTDAMELLYDINTGEQLTLHEVVCINSGIPVEEAGDYACKDGTKDCMNGKHLVFISPEMKILSLLPPDEAKKFKTSFITNLRRRYFEKEIDADEFIRLFNTVRDFKFRQ